MKKSNTVIEISHGFIKVVIGGSIENKAYVNYVKKIPLNHEIEKGAVVDRAGLVEVLTKLNPLTDEKYHINQLLDDVTLILPPYGLEVYHTSQSCTVTAKERIFTEHDITNVCNMISNKKLPVDNELLDIIIDRYDLVDSLQSYAYPPLGMPCRTFIANATVVTLPKRVINEYYSLFKEAGIKVSRMMVSSYASNECLRRMNYVPEDFILMDIGSETTSLSIVGQHRLVATRNIIYGGNSITEKIIERFNINEVEAEKIKRLYGLDNRKMNFKYPIVEKENVKHYGDELNEIITSSLDYLISLSKNAIGQIASQHRLEGEAELPIIIIGGGSKLNGLVSYLCEKMNKINIKNISPDVIGARDPSLFALLGALNFLEKSPREVEEISTPTSETLEREE